MNNQQSFNYIFNNDFNELNFFVNNTNFNAFDTLIQNHNIQSFLHGPYKSGKSFLAKIWLKNNNAIEYENNLETILFELFIQDKNNSLTLSFVSSLVSNLS